MSNTPDPYKEKFRPDDSALDKQIDAALAGMSIDELYAKADADKAGDPAQHPHGGAHGHDGGKGPRRGKIVSVTPDFVFVDLGGKSPGACPSQQFEAEPQVGEEMEFFVERFDPGEGLLILNRKGAAQSNVNWENLAIGTVVEGTVTGMNKGGLELDVKGMRAFMPSGQVDLFFMKDISVFLGQKLTAEVIQCDPAKKNLVISRKVILEREKEQARQRMLEEVAEGQIRRGTVRNITDFGAFVDLGGLDGLIHISEMTFRRGVKPGDVVKVGDQVDVKIIKFDKEKGKLSLSLNQARGIDPWADAATKYAPGTEITGRVTKVENFGAFVEVEEGFEGLLPVSEMSWRRIRHPNEVVKEGDTIRLVVLAVDPPQRRVTFSLKQASPDPWATVAERFPRDAVITGTVARTADFGAFIELEPGLEGLCHISELAPTRVRAVTDVVKPGQQVQVRVIELDKDNRRISLSIRRATEPVRPVATAAPVAATSEPPKKPKKRPQLKGGLEW
jgi:small subunit ribosomal protein S1